MLSQKIQTSRYVTTIDIPIQKLQTKSKFIQIPKQTQSQNQTIIIPSNNCHDYDQYKRVSASQTRIVIQELQQAYNDDVKEFEEKISRLTHQNQIKVLKLQNQLHYNQKLYQDQYNKNKDILDRNQTLQENAQKYKSQLKQKQAKNQLLSQKIQELISELKLSKKEITQKNNLLSTKLIDFKTGQQQKYLKELSQLKENYELNEQKSQIQYSKLSQQNRQSNYQNGRLITENHQLKQKIQNLSTQLRRSSQLNNDQTKQIDQHRLRIKDLQQIHQQNVNSMAKQSIQIEHLLSQLATQRLCIQEMSAQRVHHHQQNQFNQSAEYRLQQQVLVLSQRLFSFEQQLLEKQTLYLLKLKQNDMLRHSNQTHEYQSKQKQKKIQLLTKEINTITSNSQKLSIELSKKVLQVNELASRPLQEKVYQIKIQKTFDRKQYILQLQQKITTLEKVIKQISQGNQSYLVEIQKRIIQEASFKQREKSLQKSIQDLKEFIAKKENSVSWIVERQISKDVQISKNQSNSSHYKVFVRNCSEESNQVSEIHTRNKINFSIQSKVDSILQQQQN